MGTAGGRRAYCCAFVGSAALVIMHMQSIHLCALRRWVCMHACMHTSWGRRGKRDCVGVNMNMYYLRGGRARVCAF